MRTPDDSDRAAPRRAGRGDAGDRRRADPVRRRRGARRAPRRSGSRAAATPCSARRSASAARSSRGSPAALWSSSPSTRSPGRGRSRPRTTVKDDGSFARPLEARRHIGQFRLRASSAVRRGAPSGSPELALTVFRPAIATWYGPGFYGNTTACGIELTEETVGVAHRSLPCGTNVAVRYGSTTIVVPVVDRGPFGGEAKWDLTAAAAQMLGFTDTGRIGAIRLAATGPAASR